MEQTLLSRQDLAKRWGYESTKAIIDMEQEGVITRVPMVSSPRYSINEILEIENFGQEINPLSPIERRRLEKENTDLRKELSLYKEKLNNIKMIVI
jgi:hypothetical protein